MQEARPSRTALRVALRRAAHQTVDSPLVFRDPLAERILGPHAEELRAPQRTSSRVLRAFLVARSRYAEDTLALGIENGITQYVLLGAGLDTFAYRNPFPNLRIFEVDHPATQAWKLDLLSSSRIAVPPTVTHVPVDFEHQALATRLSQSGFRTDKPAFFAWLGVVPYLTEPAFQSTLHVIASQPPGSGFVMDYAPPPETLSTLERMAFDSLAARVAMVGEPFQLFFTPSDLASRLHTAGFTQIEDLGRDAINQRYFHNRNDDFAIMGSGRLLSAWK
ncbi:MAG: class I SAM-dependent methyltransferase [Acidobacteria bacterium]|nr:class I SAM-dependent methyltransferase [Acidobacteriota bacterium]